ncbi:MAG: AMP-binding protein, partial [Candidatus Thorarchaeota archaeon]
MSSSDANEDVPLRAFCDLLTRNALDYSDMLAVIYGNSHLTWSDLDRAISETANALLRAYPDALGERVAIIMENRPEYLASLYGAQRAGMVPAPISTRFVGREIRHVFETARPLLCICSVHYENQVTDAFPHTKGRPPMVIVDGTTDQENKKTSWSTFIEGVPSEAPSVPLRSSNLGVQLYTGGTTGLPKGTDFTHKALLDAC